MSESTCERPCAGLCHRDGLAAAHRAHRARLLGRARAVLDDHEAAEDAVQEVFLRAWSACGSFDPAAGPSLLAWLSVITRNVVVDMVRARAIRPRLCRPPADDAAEPGSTAAIDTALVRMQLLDALAAISPDHRGIVLRAVVLDRPYTDVATELDLPVGTVKSRVFYALRGLRASLDRTELAA